MKNTRIIIALVAFAVAFIFSAGLVRIIFGEPQASTVYDNHSQCSKGVVPGIESFIRRDENNGSKKDSVGAIRDKDINRYAVAYADAVTDYVDASSSLDASGFPEDFQNAWREHMQAWRNYADFANELKSPEMRKGMSVTDLRIAESPYNREINRTFEIVLSIGRTYGADI